MTEYIILGVIILLIILYLYYSWTVPTMEDYLFGMWTAEDDEFCEAAEIESMLLFIGESDGNRLPERDGYIVIMNDISNQSFTMNYKKGWSSGLGKYRIRAKVEFAEDQLWDDEVFITIDIRNGTMKIESIDESELFAKLVKQNDTTNIARGM